MQFIDHGNHGLVGFIDFAYSDLELFGPLDGLRRCHFVLPCHAKIISMNANVTSGCAFDFDQASAPISAWHRGKIRVE
jgi:hypothetical protein